MKFLESALSSFFFVTAAGSSVSGYDDNKIGLRGRPERAKASHVDETIRGKNPANAHHRLLSEYDCAMGCPHNVAPVCASELTYQNECIAWCQGERNIKKESCDNDNISSRMTFDDEGEMPLKKLTRFSYEGFNFIGTVYRARVPPGNKTMSGADEEDSNPDSSEDRSALAGAVRITSTGDVYIAKVFKPPSDEAVQEEDNAPKCAKENEDFAPPPIRSEARSVIGDDTRFRVAYRENAWPWWRVGQVEEVLCSGSIVGVNKVLTNAHCVWDEETNDWEYLSEFTPGRNYGDPWGSWEVDYATFPTSFLESSNSKAFDYAILTMKSKQSGEQSDDHIGEHIGEVLGYFPLVPALCTPHNSYSLAYVVGYPVDKPKGTMWSSGRCDSWSRASCGAIYIDHTCDTYPGNSGSPMLLNNQVFGVHAYGVGGSDDTNGGPAFTESVISTLMSY